MYVCSYLRTSRPMQGNSFAANIAVLSFERIHSFVFDDHDSLMPPDSESVFVPQGCPVEVRLSITQRNTSMEIFLGDMQKSFRSGACN